MKISSFISSDLNKKSINNLSHKLDVKSFDSVSFSSKQVETKKTLPFRLESKMQDDFHITSQQVRIRHYLELKKEGLSDEQIAREMFPKTFSEEGTDEQRKEVINYIQKSSERIKELDASFKTVVPSLVPKTYYRGIVADADNRAIKTVSEAKVGDVIQPNLWYPFWAPKLKYAEDYASNSSGNSNPENCFVMIVKTPAGTPISRDITFNLFSLDNNVVFPRGVKYEVLEKEVKNNKTYITLKYLSSAMDEDK